MNSPEVLSYIVTVSVLLIIIILFTIILAFMKIPYRKYRYLQIKKSLDEDNIKKITSEEDLEYIKDICEKFKWYSKNWYFNSTPTYLYRWNKFKKITKKYNLDIELVQYKEER